MKVSRCFPRTGETFDLPKNPTGRGLKPIKRGERRGGRLPGQPNLMTRDVRQLIRQAAEETGFITTVPVLDAEGKPTGQLEEKMIEEGENMHGDLG